MVDYLKFELETIKDDLYQFYPLLYTYYRFTLFVRLCSIFYEDDRCYYYRFSQPWYIKYIGRPIHGFMWFLLICPPFGYAQFIVLYLLLYSKIYSGFLNIWLYIL